MARLPDPLKNVLGLLTDGGLPFVLILCVFFSFMTFTEQHPTGEAAARQVAETIRREAGAGARVLVVTRDLPEERALAERMERELSAAGTAVVEVVHGEPRDARLALERAAASGEGLDALACTPVTATWRLFSDLPSTFPALAGARVVQPRSYRWPSFLKSENLLNIANQISVIAIVAIGMTMVIITAGIDLSVGSLIALSAVTAALLIRETAGGLEATAPGMLLSCLGAIGLCGLIGLATGSLITFFNVPPFIVTLGTMMVGSGLAYILANGQSVYEIPQSFTWLGRGADLGLPNAVVLMLLLYAAAHLLMSRTRLGRHIYAVGSNVEAARLSGLPLRRVLLFVYAASGLLAGLGGVVLASQLKSGSPTYGQMYELYVIAAVVVGGTSLSGGKGSMFGTAVGAFTIAIIQNGMNLMNVESYTQKVVFGLVILGAVLMDRLRNRRAPK